MSSLCYRYLKSLHAIMTMHQCNRTLTLTSELFGVPPNASDLLEDGGVTPHLAQLGGVTVVGTVDNGCSSPCGESDGDFMSKASNLIGYEVPYTWH